ncbi:fatty acyl-CoA hydrolase precursor, medium chain-like isoform X2 [Conger conger]|nr:fatty acyl-CoA hydrolase precursor, medium chain-like isoform X2 [Conger conger]
MNSLSLVFWLVGICLLFSCKTSADTKGPLVTLQSGSLRGKYVKVKGVQTVVHTYLSVPFAQPPIGPLRLAPPLPEEPWEGERDATQKPLMCLQNRQFVLDLLEKISLHMDVPAVSEDCLYLDIYTPATPKSESKLPVMVWIHGGGFVMGSSSLQDASVLAAYQDVVVVVIQYRLGILGFFSTGDEHAPGNFGLLDQVAALRWVQKNIERFGGDPGSVTIFGESAGGVSVSLQALSPLSSGLFHRAIAQSGTAKMNSILIPDQFPTAQILGNMSGCDITSSKTIVDCMKQLTEEEILKTVVEAQNIVFLVSKDGQFLPKMIEDAFQDHEVHKVPFMTGVTNQECGWLLPSFLAPPGWEEGMDRDQVLSSMSFSYRKPEDQSRMELIADEYLGTSEDRLANRDSALEMMGDIMFTIPAIQTANSHRDTGASVYLYEMQDAPSMLQKTRPSFVKMDHGDDLIFVFGLCFMDLNVTGNCTEEEEELSRTVMAYWANFARTGSPNGVGLVHWPQYGPEEEFLALGLKQQTGKHLKRGRYVFLTQTLPEKMRAQEKHSEL